MFEFFTLIGLFFSIILFFLILGIFKRLGDIRDLLRKIAEK